MNHESSDAGCKLELPSARPYAFRFRPESTTLVIIDMQRDFLDRGGFGELQCGNAEIFENVRRIVPQTKEVLKAARNLGLHVIHTREGHTPNLSDLPASKRLRQKAAPLGHHHIGIGDEGPMGRLLVRGEYGHDIIDDLKPVPRETVIDKPGKGSFWNTTLHRSLLARGITHLLIAGVTTECCVNTTFREASNRGLECCVLTDCTSSYIKPLQKEVITPNCGRLIRSYNVHGLLLELSIYRLIAAYIPPIATAAILPLKHLYLPYPILMVSLGSVIRNSSDLNDL